MLPSRTSFMGLIGLLSVGIMAGAHLDGRYYTGAAPLVLEVVARDPNLSAEDMWAYYTRPIESALASFADVKEIHPNSFYGSSIVDVAFAQRIECEAALIRTSRHLQNTLTVPNKARVQVRIAWPYNEPAKCRAVAAF
jgi:multidrug efflux pump subunit AcrB